MELVLNFGIVKSDEEIVYGPIGLNYPFFLSVEELIMNSKRAKKYMKTGDPPRPLNSFMIYRKNKNEKPEFKKKDPGFISTEITKMWKKEPKEIKELFEALARMAEKKHIEIYGKDYKYRPKKSQKKQKTKAKHRMNLT